MKEIKAQNPEGYNCSHKVNQHQGGSLSVDQYEESNHLKGVSQPQDARQNRDLSQHRDYPQFLKWKEMQKDAANEILENSEVYKGALEVRGIDPHVRARLFVNKKQDKASQYKQAAEFLKRKNLDHLIGAERSPGHSVEVRSAAKAALIKDWKHAHHLDPTQSLLMLAYSNLDVRALNTQARALLKSSGSIGKEDFTYTITREVEDDFGRRAKVKEEREFSKGDRIVFTRNKGALDKGNLGVKNGSMGTILSLDKKSIEVALDKGSLNKGGLEQEKTLTFSPNIFPFFDQGWAVTIHKSQGTTVDKSFILASHEMNQNLAYVAMTRHREDVHVYGSTLDFWRPEKVSEVLSKSGEKIGAADYLDSKSLSLLMKDEDKFLTKLFTRLGDELQAMGAASKRAFGVVADHFLRGFFESTSERSLDDRILLKPEILIKKILIKETLREEDRADEILKKSTKDIEKKPERLEAISGSTDTLSQQYFKVNHTLQDVYEDWTHPAFKDADFYKRVFKEGLKIHGDHTSVEAGAIQYWNEKREPYMKIYEKKLEAVAVELASPLLNYMSNESRDLAHKAAIEDPDRALSFLAQVKASKQAEKDSQEKAHQPPSPALKENSKDQSSSLHSPQGASTPLSSSWKQEDETLQRNAREAMSSYFKFKELIHEQKSSLDDSDLKKNCMNSEKHY